MRNKRLLSIIINKGENLFDCCLMIDADKRLFDVQSPMKAPCHKKILFDCCFTKQLTSMNTEADL